MLRTRFSQRAIRISSRLFNSKGIKTSTYEHEDLNESSSRDDVLLESRKNNVGALTDTIWAQTFDGLPSMVHVMSIVRFIEKRFGRVREFQVLRDSDLPTTYRKHLFLSFHSPDVLSEFPEAGRVVQVPVPIFKPKPGGVGLEDVMDLLAPYDGPVESPNDKWVSVAEQLSRLDNEEEVPNKDSTLIEVTLKRAHYWVLPASQKQKLEAQRRYILSEDTYTHLARAFTKFGGFQSANSGEKQNDVMRRVLIKYEAFLERTAKGAAWTDERTSRRLSVDDPTLSSLESAVSPWSSHTDNSGSRSGAVVLERKKT